jgi:hypothetical protein
MIDDKAASKANDRSQPVSPEREEQQAQQSQMKPVLQPSQRTAPGRRPLFGDERSIRRSQMY